MSLLKVQNLVKNYRDPSGELRSIIDIPEFELQQGEQFALEGSSGSGKTTFLNLLAGILKCDRGCILLDGKDITQMTEGERDQIRANHIGYVFQNFNLLQGFTALENVILGMVFGKGVQQEFAEYLLERVKLKEKQLYRPAQLSLGQQQRVALARALANKPRLVIADEPTGNLDAHNAREALRLIRELCKENNTALLLVSHDPAILAQFEKTQKMADFNRAAVERLEENVK